MESTGVGRMSLPQPINWLRNVSCPLLVFSMEALDWPKERKEREQILVSMLRGNLEGKELSSFLLSVIDEEDRMEVMEILQNIPAFKESQASWHSYYFFDIPYYALVSSEEEVSDEWYCLILPTARLGSWSKELNHDWIDAYSRINEEEVDGFEGLGSLFG